MLCDAVRLGTYMVLPKVLSKTFAPTSIEAVIVHGHSARVRSFQEHSSYQAGTPHITCSVSERWRQTCFVSLAGALLIRRQHRASGKSYKPSALRCDLTSAEAVPTKASKTNLRRFQHRQTPYEEPPPRCPPLVSPDAADYPQDLQAKADRVSALLETRLRNDGIDALEVIASPEHVHYRHRVKFELHHSDGGIVDYRIYDPGSLEWRCVTNYPIASLRINRLMLELKDALDSSTAAREEAFQVELLSNLHGDALACIFYHRPLKKVEDADIATKLAWQLDASIVMRAKGQRLVARRKKDYLRQQYEVGGCCYTQFLHENVFFQANLEVNRQMQQWLFSHTSASQGCANRDLLELYCGNGNFTLPLAANFRRVFATEVDKLAVASAKSCATDAKASNIKFVRAKAEDLSLAPGAAKSGPGTGYDFSTLLVDPPRAGLDEKTRKLAAGFERVLYISCNPLTLVRDLEDLRSLRVVSACLFDQFPWIDHAEVALLLER
eukprot:TRINITY_DN25664_c0_g1_i1.p1 TRINITY_DN25664_c0_g1~~TRINITY_DN25664_c0_g1_i1.p1  ORF type:complete len:496 (-),score=65.85 TRINITY_DN25664_c0_g1_i1:21-1508(-)